MCLSTTPIVPLKQEEQKHLHLDYTIWLLALLALLLLEDSTDTSPNELWRLSGIDRLPDSSLFVVVDNGPGLSVISAQPLFEGLGVVVRSLNEGFSSLVIRHCLLWGVDW